MILAIDPGSTQSGYVVWDVLRERVCQHAIVANDDLLAMLGGWTTFGRAVIESTKPRGMPASLDLFETLWWAGRFHQRILDTRPDCRVEAIDRLTVKRTICGTTAASDSNIRAAIIDLFGGQERAIGRKASPGPLYGVVKHEWAALALALTTAPPRAMR